MVLQSMLDEIQAKDLPIDILVASKSIKPQKNLLVIDPIAEFSLPNYAHQPLRIPNYLTIHNLFLHGRYDRVMVSTEGPMGMAALYLKHAFSVKAHFYLHTDWITFAKKALKFDSTATSRLRRILRWYYQNFDHVFVLNKEQQKWLIGKQMNLSPESVKLTAHWTDAQFIKHMVSKSEMFNISHDAPVVLFAGRISEEKGVDELPAIMAKLIEEIPNAQLVVAGKGPYEDKLKEQYPQAIFLGWVDHANLPKIYSAADICILPSKFDTFSMVVLEAISCGLPVIAYNTKGPKEILEETNAGFLVSKKSEMQDKMIQYFKNPAMQAEMKHAAIKRSGDFSSHQILSDFLAVVEL
jgi:glycosyltransferase involved in cell wall biosynthesis